MRMETFDELGNVMVNESILKKLSCNNCEDFCVFSEFLRKVLIILIENTNTVLIDY